MIHALTKTSLALALIAALPVASSIAEPHAPRVAAPAVIDAQDPIKFSFEGGTASDLFGQVSKAYPDFPVVLGQKAKKFEVAGFEARITKPETIVELVCGVEGTLLGSDARVRATRGMLDYRNVNNELVSISFTPMGFPVQRQSVRVLSIQELLTSGMNIEEVMGTVSAGITLQGENQIGQNAVVRFHQETGVLFIKGSKASNEMIAQTIEALTASAKWRVSPEAIAAKEALIKSEALEFLERTTKQQATMQRSRLEQLQKDHERLMEEQRKREDAKDAELERQLDEEFGKEDE